MSNEMTENPGQTLPMSEGGPWGTRDEEPSSGKGKEGPRNPWTPPPRNEQGGQDSRGPSAIDELMRRARDSFGGNGGGGARTPGGRAIWFYGAIALVVLWIATTSIHRIGPQERGIVSILGSYSRTLGPGINWSLPAPLESVTVLDVEEIRTVDLGSAGDESEKLVLTGDQNIINLGYSVRWNIRDPQQYLFQIANPEETITAVSESAMRAVVATVSLTDALGAGRNAIEAQVQERMQQILDSYGAGVRIQGVAIKQADPPAAVNDAFKEVSAAQQAAETYLNQARAYAQQLAARSQGEAGAFDRVYEEYRLAPEVTRRRMYYETMENVLSGVNKTILEAPGVTPYLPLPALRPRATTTVEVPQTPQQTQQGGAQ
ncbi:MAG: FtsH protease activity modulator HflK [Alphaproteobacteria bacterium]|nr:FtsH protease activity modulator HflK [Alphaproteobacteria bacterium]MBU0875639.1 FtsH protease activity modulator HflK [Alphaproteobacteria bacterium]MBU1771486.1 FtsH protease activity modulator HflK [Alphaproteobacteria bacterium]